MSTQISIKACTATDEELLQILDEVGYDVDASSGCWIWKGLKNEKGYGRLRLGGKDKLVHREVYRVEHGYAELPVGVVVRHSCDRPGCRNGAHLREGTQQDNVNDMMSRGRDYWATATVCHKGHTLAQAPFADGSRCGTCRTSRKTRRIQQDVFRQRINGDRFEAMGAAWDLEAEAA